MNSDTQSGMLCEKAVLVTGAGSGIGAALALRLGKARARVFCTSRTQTDLDRVTSEIRANGGTAFAFPADATIAHEMEALATEIEARFGGLDIAFLNAGGNWHQAPIVDSDVKEWQMAMNQNLLPVYLGIRSVVPLMRRRGGGRIIFTGSAMAHYAAENNSSYCAGKAAARMVAKTASLELAGENITVNEFIPGPVRSKQALAHYDESDRSSPFNNPLEWVKEPDDVVDMLLFMASYPGAGPNSQIFSLARR